MTPKACAVLSIYYLDSMYKGPLKQSERVSVFSVTSCVYLFSPAQRPIEFIPQSISVCNLTILHDRDRIIGQVEHFLKGIIMSDIVICLPDTRILLQIACESA